MELLLPLDQSSHDRLTALKNQSSESSCPHALQSEALPPLARHGKRLFRENGCFEQEN